MEDLHLLAHGPPYLWVGGACVHLVIFAFRETRTGLPAVHRQTAGAHCFCSPKSDHFLAVI